MMHSVAMLLVALALVGCGAPAPTGGSAAPVAAACVPQIDRGVLPDWARTGFSDPEPRMPHVIGMSGEVAAILFGDPLSSPPSGDHANKILWVARQLDAAAPQLSISAQRMDGTKTVGTPVERSVEGGPGPSTIDLPEPGCWRMTLRWADRTDTLDLAYRRPA